MVQLCAKPGCSETVVLWLDFAPGYQQVIERAARRDSTVGLCESHAARFTVPAGWSFERLVDDGPAEDPVVEDASDTEPAVDPGSRSKRQHRRDRPWFLALSNARERSPEADASRVVTNPAPTSDLSAGTLLHRAFHGPDPETDAIRAEQAHHDELEQRRSVRSGTGSADDIDDGVAELPFPPSEAGHRAAVS